MWLSVCLHSDLTLLQLVLTTYSNLKSSVDYQPCNFWYMIMTVEQLKADIEHKWEQALQEKIDKLIWYLSADIVP